MRCVHVAIVRNASGTASEQVNACQMETVLSLRERKRGDKLSIVYSEADLEKHKPGLDDDGEPG